jgi:hypothetical protein
VRRLSLVAFLALILLAAGFAASQAPCPTPPSTLQALAPVKLADASISGAPSLAVAPDGTMYVAMPYYLWRSDDAGATWHAIGQDTCDFPVALSTCPPTYARKDPGLEGVAGGDLAVDGNGTLHWVGLINQANTIDLPYQSSSDKGATWSSATELVDPPTGLNLPPWIDTAAQGHVMAAWADDNQLAFRHSGDGGSTWGPEQRWTPYGAIPGPVTHDPNSSAVYVPFTVGSQGIDVSFPYRPTGVSIGHTDDYGQTWNVTLVAPMSSTPKEDSPTLRYPVAAVDDAGTVYLVWSADDRFPVNLAPTTHLDLSAIHLSVSHDHGATWSAPTVISTPGHPAVEPWIVAGKAGGVAVAWYEGRLKAPGQSVPNAWDVRLIESTDAGSAAPTWTGAILNEEPVHRGTVCTYGDWVACDVTGRDNTLRDFFQVAIGPDGLPRAVWLGDGDVPTQTTAIWFGGLATGDALR